jgi:hypothetical protein
MSKASVRLDRDGQDVAPLPIGAAAGAEHALLTPSAMYVDAERLFFGPPALKRAETGVASRRNPIVSFKMILSAREIESTLALKFPRSIDPTGTLRHRDGIVLYLAYLDQLIRAAVALEDALAPSIADAPRRLTSPHWQSFDEAGRVIARLVDESIAVSAELGPGLISDVGVDMASVKQALDRAVHARESGYFDGIVFESLSAASAYANFARATAPLVLVIDMGAGTTDIAAFERDSTVAPSGLAEIPGSRQCCILAGDELDNILIDLLVRSSGKRNLDQQDKLWRAVKLAARPLKQELFQQGRSVFKTKNGNAHVSRDTLANDPAFRDYCRALTQAIAASLMPLIERARAVDAQAVTVLLAGGGSNLPFLADLVKAAAAKVKFKLPLRIESFGANWTLPHHRHPFTGVFPQLAIAMGGALAPVMRFSARAPELA